MSNLRKRRYSEERKEHVERVVTQYVLDLLSGVFFSKGKDLPSETHVKMANLFKKKVMRRVR